MAQLEAIAKKISAMNHALSGHATGVSHAQR